MSEKITLEVDPTTITSHQGVVVMPFQRYENLVIKASKPSEKIREIRFYITCVQLQDDHKTRVFADAALAWLDSLDQDVLESQTSRNTCCSDTNNK